MIHSFIFINHNDRIALLIYTYVFYPLSERVISGHGPESSWFVNVSVEK